MHVLTTKWLKSYPFVCSIHPFAAKHFCLILSSPTHHTLPHFSSMQAVPYSLGNTNVMNSKGKLIDKTRLWCVPKAYVKCDSKKKKKKKLTKKRIKWKQVPNLLIIRHRSWTPKMKMKECKCKWRAWISKTLWYAPSSSISYHFFHNP